MDTTQNLSTDMTESPARVVPSNPNCLLCTSLPGRTLVLVRLGLFLSWASSTFVLTIILRTINPHGPTTAAILASSAGLCPTGDLLGNKDGRGRDQGCSQKQKCGKSYTTDMLVSHISCQTWKTRGRNQRRVGVEPCGKFTSFVHAGTETVTLTDADHFVDLRQIPRDFGFSWKRTGRGMLVSRTRNQTRARSASLYILDSGPQCHVLSLLPTCSVLECSLRLDSTNNNYKRSRYSRSRGRCRKDIEWL